MQYTTPADLDGLGMYYERSAASLVPLQHSPHPAPGVEERKLHWSANVPGHHLPSLGMGYDEDEDEDARSSSVDIDSVLDMYGTDDEEEGPAAEALRLEHAALARPWDERGVATGLYGGGGTGADNQETGWVREDYELAHSAAQEAALREASLASGPRVSLTAGGASGGTRAYEQRRMDGANTRPSDYSKAHRRNSSSGTDPSLYGPETPLDPNFPDMIQRRISIAAPRGQHHAARRISPQPMALNLPSTETVAPTTTLFTAPRTKPTLQLAPPTVRRQSEPPKEVTRPPFVLGSKSTATTPTNAHFPITRPLSAPENKRRKSLVNLLRTAGRSKKNSLSISNPILPQGFVESLGISTFDLHVAPLAMRSGVPAAQMPRTMRDATGGGSIFVEQVGDAPAAVEHETSPRHAEGSRQALARLSYISAASEYAASLASLEHGRQAFFDDIREGEAVKSPPTRPMLVQRQSSDYSPVRTGDLASTATKNHNRRSSINEVRGNPARLSSRSFTNDVRRSITPSSLHNVSAGPGMLDVSTFSAYSNSNSSVTSIPTRLSTSPQHYNSKSAQEYRLSALAASMSAPSLQRADSAKSRIAENHEAPVPLPKGLSHRPSHAYQKRQSTTTPPAAISASGSAVSTFTNPFASVETVPIQPAAPVAVSTGWNPGW